MSTEAKPAGTAPPSAQTLMEAQKVSVNYGVCDSFKVYFSKKPLQFFEDQLLQTLPFYPEPADNRRVEIINTPIDGNECIHEVYLENTLPCENPLEIVLIHGWGAGLGFFYRNFDSLTSLPGTKLHAIDMLGFGGSSRPTFPDLDGTTKEGVLKSEDFFTDSFESWRINRGIDKFILMAHSLGGYLSGAYYLKYGRDVVQKLVMISPVGVERSDLSFNSETQHLSLSDEAHIAETEGVDLRREISGKLEDSNNVDLDIVSLNSDFDESEANQMLYQVRKRVEPGKFFAGLWEKNYSPLSIVRAMGPFAAKATSQWSYSRFARIDNEDELFKINDYTTRIFLAKGSGEYALTRILAPGALARMPLLDRLPKELAVESLWLYGEYDWMSKKAGYQMCNEIKANNETTAHIRIIGSAGHHLYIDNREEFTKYVLAFLQDQL